MRFNFGFKAVPAVLLLAAFAAPLRADGEADRAKAIGKALEFLRKNRNPDGSFGSEKAKGGVTGIAVTGLIESGAAKPEDEIVAGALKFIETLIDPSTGHIAGRGSAVGLHNYCTCVNVMALQAANRPEKYKSVVGDAVKFLKQLQWDEGEGKTDKDDFYGGAGYDSKSRPDLSNTQFFLDALKDAGVPSGDPAVQKALTFVSRCQNLKSEFNDRPWAGKINDGSFIYSQAGGGSTKTSDAAGAPLEGYGSMTYAGIKSMIYCGVSKNDERYKKAYEWIAKNYAVHHHAGMPKELGARGLYYYYHTMAKSLTAMGVDEVTDAKGVKHDWRKEIAAALVERQKPDGSWANPTDRWMEGDPLLVTGYALMTLSYCKK